MKVLVDTSVWSLALRRSRKRPDPSVAELAELIATYRVSIIGPIRQELLSGVKDDDTFDRLRKHLGAFPDEPLESDDFVEAAQFFNRCRRKGIQGSNTDFLLCAVANRRNQSIFTHDRDFERFAKHVPVTLYRTSA